MSDRSVAISPVAFSSTVTTSLAAARPAAARTKLLLEGPVLPTLLRLAAPNILNLLAIAGMITFDGLFVGRLGPDALAGVSLAFPFVMLIQHTAASGMGGGVSSAIARALVPASAMSPMRLPFTLLFSPSVLRRHSPQCCCSAHPSSFDGWAGTAKCYRPGSPTQTWRSAALCPSAC